MKLLYTSVALALLMIGSGIVVSGGRAEQNPDANCDGAVSAADISIAVTWFGLPPPEKGACSGNTGESEPISTYGVIGTFPIDLGDGIFGSLAVCDAGDAVSGGGETVISPTAFHASAPIYSPDTNESAWLVLADDSLTAFQSVATCIDNGSAHVASTIQAQSIDIGDLGRFDLQRYKWD